MIYDISTSEISTAPIPRYWHITTPKRIFFLLGLNPTSASSLENVYFIKCPGAFGLTSKPLSPGIYMRSRSLTAGSAGRHAYTQNLLQVCVVTCVSPCVRKCVSACVRRISLCIARTRSSMIFCHNRSSKGLDFGFAEKRKKLAPLTPTRIAFTHV